MHALSFDVEDYFQVSNFEHVIPFRDWSSWPSRVERNTEIILSALEEASVHATFFVLGWCAEHHPKLVRRIAELGHEVAAHSYDHRLVYELSPDEFREDLRRTRGILEDAAQVEIVGYRAPSFSITEESLWALDVLIEEGYRFDSSIFPVHHHRYGISSAPRFPYHAEREGGRLAEFPLSTYRLFNQNLPIAGGGYFRLLPYPVLRSAYRRLTRASQPAILYLHPWEFDPDQPRVPGVPKLRTIRHRLNLKGSLAKLKKMLQDFEFSTVSDVLGGLGLLETGDQPRSQKG